MVAVLRHQQYLADPRFVGRAPEQGHANVLVQIVGLLVRVGDDDGALEAPGTHGLQVPLDHDSLDEGVVDARPLELQQGALPVLPLAFLQAFAQGSGELQDGRIRHLAQDVGHFEARGFPTEMLFDERRIKGGGKGTAFHHGRQLRRVADEENLVGVPHEIEEIAQGTAAAEFRHRVARPGQV